MGALVLIGFGLAKFYYDSQNKAIDPRIREAREQYARYDALAQANDFQAVFNLLDSVEDIYSDIDFYKDSYEVGVLYNNRAAAFLSMALYFDNNSISLDGRTVLSKDSLLALADQAVNKSIRLYQGWIDTCSHDLR